VFKLGEFVVSAAREGNAKAIMVQRFAINTKKVILGRFRPEAEGLSRCCGQLELPGGGSEPFPT